MVLVTPSTPNPTVGEEFQKANLDTTVGEDARSLDLYAAKILPEGVASTWEVHRLWQILPRRVLSSVYLVYLLFMISAS
jgi:hypothetical protein